MGEFSLDGFDERMVGARWSDAQSVHSRSKSVRLVIRYRSSDRIELCGHRHRDGDRWIDRLSFVDLRYRRDKTDGGSDLAKWCHSDLSVTGHGRSDDSNGRGCGGYVVGDDG